MRLVSNDGPGINHYILDEDSDGFGNYTRESLANELVAFTAGWLGLSEGWYVQVSRRGLCVIEFGTTKRSALRYARRAWKREWDRLHPNKGRGYPKVVECE